RGLNAPCTQSPAALAGRARAHQRARVLTWDQPATVTSRGAQAKRAVRSLETPTAIVLIFVDDAPFGAREDRGHRSGLCRSAGRHLVRPQAADDRLRYPAAPDRSAEARTRRHAGGHR